ncbi:hypothetical protein D9613_009048 [Agrocybe pediades]|uniref:BTB domain-containing protein n=1 Tax=Agrocybe pediades TaxID=84607 RepID=A0A8H4R5N4_9AGAR|nr:hypothetical protein D9613_009048 [Agrocybe pediades]
MSVNLCEPTNNSDTEIPRLHPQFSSPLADVILVSSDETGFRVPLFTLRHTCGYFRDLLCTKPKTSLPASQYLPYKKLLVLDSQSNSNDGRKKEVTIIDVSEPDATLHKFLLLISGLSIDTDDSDRGWDLSELEAVLELSQRWDAPGPISVLRSFITAPYLFVSSDANALRIYDITSRMGWEEECRAAYVRTLGLNLFDAEWRPYLEKMKSAHLMRLLRFHRERRDRFKEMLDDEELFNQGNSSNPTCTGCGEPVNNFAWRELKVRMFMELDRRPLGDAICGLDMEEWPEAIACWEAKCKKDDCGRLNYDRLSTLRKIQTCALNLPTHLT